MEMYTLFIENKPDLQKQSWWTLHVFKQVIWNEQIFFSVCFWEKKNRGKEGNKSYCVSEPSFIQETSGWEEPVHESACKGETPN